eukprot:2277-Hanusia_phi.AAC.1
MLDAREFAIAMHLIDIRKKEGALPSSVPQQLLQLELPGGGSQKITAYAASVPATAAATEHDDAVRSASVWASTVLEKEASRRGEGSLGKEGGGGASPRFDRVMKTIGMTSMELANFTRRFQALAGSSPHLSGQQARPILAESGLP